MGAARPYAGLLSRPRTLVFGIGAAKCGTSWFNALLRSHPQVHVAHQRELHYWDTVRPPFHMAPARRAERELAQWQAQPALRRLMRWPAGRYWRLANRMRGEAEAPHDAYSRMVMTGYRRQPVVGEVTPAYALLGPETYAEMAGLNDDTRFVFLMRDPVDRMHSAVRHRLRKDGMTELGEDDVLDALHRHLQDPDFVRGARYDRTIAALEAAVPRDRIHYEFFEDLFTPEAAARLFDFLNVPPGRVDTAARNVGLATGRPRDAAFARAAHDALAPVYDFAEAKFGDALPHAWRQWREAPPPRK